MMETKPGISILISVYEQQALTRHCLDAIEKTLHDKVPYEVIIVDDNSGDAMTDFLETLGPPHHIIFNSKRRGFAHNNNLAARQAKGEFLCLLNNDVLVQGDWLLPMIRVLKEHADAGIVGNVQRLTRNSLFDHMGVVFAPQGNPRHFGQHFFFRPFKGKIQEWSAVTAACCVCRRKNFDEMNGFDEIFLNGSEDMDLCLRMSEQGWKIFVVHDSVVRHVKGATESRKRHNSRNARILEERWGAKIRANQGIQDQKLHAWNYLYRGLARPFSCNIFKLWEALLIALRIKRL